MIFCKVPRYIRIRHLVSKRTLHRNKSRYSNFSMAHGNRWYATIGKLFSISIIALLLSNTDCCSLYCNRNCTPSTSRNSCSSCGPCIRRFTPRGSPRHEARLIELMCTQFVSISFTASSETDEPQRFRWLKIIDCYHIYRLIIINYLLTPMEIHCPFLPVHAVHYLWVAVH